VRKVEALDAGADDFLVKPFSVSELLARIRSVWRRVAPAGGEAPMVCQLGELTVSPELHVATVGDHRLNLTPKEFALLEFLARNSHRVSAHRDLLREIWGDGYVDEVHYIRNVVKSVRTKLADVGARAQIVNERGIGYRLECTSDD
jgi:two-component system, OmpR family, KDP operon response regulator KdpE